MRPHAAWNVRIQIARATFPRRPSRRVRISPAALFVNVIARTSFGFTPQALIRCAARWVRTRVFPEPAPAITSSGPSVVSTASCWTGFRSARYSCGFATAMPPMLAAQAQLLAERDKSGDEEHQLGGGVARSLIRDSAGSERRENDGSGGQRDQQPRPAGELERQVVEDIAGLAGN